MTRQDYELIAETVRGLPENPTKLHVACAFVDALENNTGHFKAKKFMAECGIAYPVDDKETMDAQDISVELDKRIHEFEETNETVAFASDVKRIAEEMRK